MLFAPAIGAKCSIHTAWKAKHLAEHQMIGLHGTKTNGRGEDLNLLPLVPNRLQSLIELY